MNSILTVIVSFFGILNLKEKNSWGIHKYLKLRNRQKKNKFQSFVSKPYPVNRSSCMSASSC